MLETLLHEGVTQVKKTQNSCIHHSAFYTHHSAFPPPLAFSLQPLAYLPILQSSFFIHFSPAFRNAAIWRSSISGSLIGALSL